MHFRAFLQSLAAILCWSLVFQSFTFAQNPAQETTAIAELNIIVVQSEGALNNIKQRTAREPIVRVEDQNHKPVAGAIVSFVTPNQGASGTFLNGAHNIQAVSDLKGEAVARGFHPNTVTGKFEIHVSASYDGKMSQAVISQTNIVASAAVTSTTLGLSAKTWVIVASIAAAAGAGAGVALSRGGSSGTTVASSTATVTAPHP